MKRAKRAKRHTKYEKSESEGDYLQCAQFIAAS
jgi:hypothetical protein